MILIVDYGLGNLGSIQNMLKKVGVQSRISSDKDEVLRAERIIIPGVGRFDHGMHSLNDSGLRTALDEVVKNRGVPTLGICLGMQLLGDFSEEGGVEGLSWIPGKVKRFRFAAESPLRVPHMGWNLVGPTQESEIFSGFMDPLRFYFVHSYFFEAVNQNDVIGVTEYGHKFASVIQRKNVIGAQFHPEKSHSFGFQLLKNFSVWRPHHA